MVAACAVLFMVSLIYRQVRTFSDVVAPSDIIVCSLLHEKCEWRRDWHHANGIRRDLYHAQPTPQYFYFCNQADNSTIENCNLWLDENDLPVPGASTLDKLVDDVFTIPELSFNMTGTYRKLPEEENDIEMIVE